MPDLTQLIPTELITELYRDLAKPGIQNVGKALGTILGLGNTILLPIHMANDMARERVKRNLELYRVKLKDKRIEDIISPSPDIAVPILEKLFYVEDLDIADLYASLLATASVVTSKSVPHPTFAFVVNHLTGDEAKIIRYLAEHSVVPYETLRATDKDRESSYARRYRIVTFRGEDNVGLTSPKNATLYAENLEGLGILEDRKSPLSQKLWYDAVVAVNDIFVHDWLKDQPNLVIERAFGYYHLTTLGAEFVIACGHDDDETVSQIRRWRD